MMAEENWFLVKGQGQLWHFLELSIEFGQGVKGPDQLYHSACETLSAQNEEYL